MSAKLYVHYGHNDKPYVYQGELSDIELLLSINSGYGYFPRLEEVTITQVTPDAIADVKQLYEEIEAKTEEVKNLRRKLDQVLDHKLLSL